MAGSKRERELARAKYERQQQRRAERAAKRRRRNQVVAVVVVLAIVVGGIVWFALGRRSSNPADTIAAEPTPSLSLPTEASGDASPEPDGSGQPSASDQEAVPVDCTPPKDTRANDRSWDAAPEPALKKGASYDIAFTTNCGKFVVATDPKAAPETVNSMVFLAEQGYFDLTKCHRVTTAGIYVLQCGDPAGDGSGGPGYTVPDENLPAEGENNYPAGTVAMANAGAGTGGSQFFVVYGDTTLPAGYTIWGTVTSGLDVVQGIADAGVEGGGTDGPPAQPVVIEKAKVTTS